jgi:hypothetical protein
MTTATERGRWTDSSFRRRYLNGKTNKSPESFAVRLRQEISRLFDGLTIGLPLALRYEFQRDDKILHVA